MSRLKVYTYRNCDTCRRAVKWLGARGRVFDERAIRETPPSVAELRVMLAALQGERRRLFNTSGADFRELGLKDRLPLMDESEMFALLAANGNLVKRPFLLGAGVALVGFDAAVWAAALGK